VELPQLHLIKVFCPIDTRTIAVVVRSFAVDRRSVLDTVPKKGCHRNGERLYIHFESTLS